MDQDQQHIVELQPLKVLDLFPKRQIQTLTLNYQNYSKLYQNLTCTICRQLFKSPVYLKCSHRFCKECIQKYIRSSTKRSCPNCRGQLSTKRDLRSDYSLQSLITFAFSDVKSFSASMEQFDKLDIQRSKSLELKKIDSMNDCKQRTKQQTSEQFVNVTSGLKRVKTNDLDQPKKKRKMQNQKKIQIKNSLQKQEKEASLSNKASKMIEQKQVSKQVEVISKRQIIVKPQTTGPVMIIQNFTKQKSRKKKIQVIQIESNSQQHDQEVQEIRREQFLNPAQLVQDKKISSFSAIPEVLPQLDSKVYSFQEIPIQGKSSMQEQKDERHQKDQPRQKLNCEQQLSAKMSKQSSDNKKQVNPQILKAIQLLQGQFGSNYPLKVIELTPFPFYTDLTLKKHPFSILTPETVHGSYKFSLRTALTSVSTFIAESLNISGEAIKLHTVLGIETLSYVQVSPSLKLYQVNQRYWKNWSGIELLQLIELINGACQESSIARKIQRIIYYSIDFSKLST